MDDSFPNSLPLWRGNGPTSLAERAAAEPRLPTPPSPSILADKLYYQESLLPPGRAPRPGEGAEPYTLQWFLDIEQQRYNRYGRWLPRMLEFTKHAGETLLGLEGGLGTDWTSYAREGVNVIAASASTDHLALVRRNFELRGLKASFIHADPKTLPLESASIDVVCTGHLLLEKSDPVPVIKEVYRVLRPGGKVIAVAGARYDVDHWSSFWFPWQRWWIGKKAEATTIRYSARELWRLFPQFSEHRVSKRHLRRAETPHLWRWMPPFLLERIVGRNLILKAFKPLSAAMAAPLAA